MAHRTHAGGMYITRGGRVKGAAGVPPTTVDRTVRRAASSEPASGPSLSGVGHRCDALEA